MKAGADAPTWTRQQAERWRAALPPRWLPTPGALFGVCVVVVLGGITFPAENEHEWHVFSVVFPTVVAILALLTWGSLFVWRRDRARQETIARGVARGSLGPWPGPSPDASGARPLDTAARAARAFRKLQRVPLPVTTMRVRIDGPVVVLHAIDDDAPMLRLPCRVVFGHGGVSDERLERELEWIETHVPADEDPDDLDREVMKAFLDAVSFRDDVNDLRAASVAGGLLATVYGLPVVGGYLGVAVPGGANRPDAFLLTTAVARRPPRSRLGGRVSSYADLLWGARRFPG
jgi:hypothetical protein